MKVQQLYPSELLRYQDTIQQARLLFPFDAVHSQAAQRMLQALKKGRVYCITVQHTQLFIEIQKIGTAWQVHNFLTVGELSWQEGIGLLETAARQNFRSQVVLVLAAPLPLANWLIDRGYTECDCGWRKKLTYNTALVLGGGGARGAYQIGVWKAMLENKLPFQWVAGCSVGALNGALIAQGDLKAAETLWQEISTDKVLEISFDDLERADFSDHVHQLRQFVFEAIQQKGLSTAPLRKLLESHLDADKLTKSVPLYVVATRIPTFQEVVVKLNEQTQSRMLPWLLASSAFFPLMSIESIDEHFYVDGGYRNNVPVDVALKQGASEVIVVDVHGPGIDKAVKVPSNVARIQLASTWDLGEMLLFESDRSQANIQLGYLEMQRCLGKNQGQRYFFEPTENFTQLTRAFIAYVQRKFALSLARISDIQRKNYNQPLEQLSLSLLEQWAEWLQVSPLKIYRINDLVDLLCQNVENDKEISPIVSVKEHLNQRWQEMNRLSTYNRTIKLYQQQVDNWEAAFSAWPLPTLLALFLTFIQEEVLWQESLVTKS
ncbi:patatin-like phospholipase family protein [Enterococcus sp. 669A]|uniref:Patatin-like phospholipase family protein n=1 Tax=Candidatus Enterococcus moelleringii TaxID=2815325 RepID=A0ABS3L5G7_9ENTE|nr:patatin-like phospholipase family protein [Enterococcus sp. 669A]MBO1304853.1 patatin-like phospholipase family protein [Enterococcus sp. 669A]